jgi:hypothetical protein
MNLLIQPFANYYDDSYRSVLCILVTVCILAIIEVGIPNVVRVGKNIAVIVCGILLGLFGNVLYALVV